MFDCEDGFNVVWVLFEGSQVFVIGCLVYIIFYEGMCGFGKIDCQFMVFCKFVGCGYGCFWWGVIFDWEYKNLDDFVFKFLCWFFVFNDGVCFFLSNLDYKWVWLIGEELFF